MIKIYQKQPLQAEQFDGIQKYMFGHKVISDNSLVDALTHDPVYYSIIINEDDSDDPEEEPNEVVFVIGDWIIKDGEDIHAIADDIFNNKYAELPVIPKAVAEYIESAKHDGTDMNNPDVILAAMGAIEFDQANINVSEWIQDNGDDFARAWLDGYRVE